MAHLHATSGRSCPVAFPFHRPGSQAIGTVGIGLAMSKQDALFMPLAPGGAYRKSSIDAVRTSGRGTTSRGRPP